MAGSRSGQWVTLSKALLLQLVERICQLSFQTDVASSTASSRVYRKSSDEFGPEVEIESFWRRPKSAVRDDKLTEPVFGDNSGRDVMKDCDTGKEKHDSSMPTVPDDDQTACSSAETHADILCGDADQNVVVELDVDDASANVDKPVECSGTGTEEDAVQGTSEGSLSESDRRQRRRRQRSAGRRCLLRTRRRKRATFVGQVAMKVVNDDDGAGRRTHLRGVRRCRQTWMALSKDIVYGAVENELRLVDESPVPSASSPTKSIAAIWNPATCLSPSEKQRRSRPSSDSAVPVTLSDFRYRDVMLRQPGSDVISRSSMLSDLLGFGSTAPIVVPPAEIVLTRQRHCSDTTTCDVLSPTVSSTSGITVRHSHARPMLEPCPSHSDSAALNYCVRRGTSYPEEEVAARGLMNRIWRPVGSYPVQSTSRRVVRPRWVAVNKGDVCSLVDNLVSRMIVSEDRSIATSADVRDASTSGLPRQTSSSVTFTLPVTARCSVAASEPRKWKSDLLQRLRNEDTT